MGIISGQDAKLQIGLETAWGTGVTATQTFDFTSESLKYVVNRIEEDALLGRKTTGRMDLVGVKTEGDFAGIIKPDNIGMLLFATLGAEAVPTLVPTTTGTYKHVFTPVAGGTTGSLPSISIIVDRKVAIFRYVSSKIDSMSLEANVNDYLRGTFSTRGYSEETGTLASVAGSILKAFRFMDGVITIDGVPYNDITKFSMSYSNNLENDLQTMGSNQYMAEIQPQGREITASLEVLYSATTNATRELKYKIDSTVSLEATFTSVDNVESVVSGDPPNEITTHFPYSLKIKMPLGYITEASPNVSGADRIKQTLEIKATENDTNEAITIELVDAKATKHGV